MTELRPEFFDIFGALVFSYILAVSGYALFTRKKLPRLIIVGLFLIGLGGLIVDLFFVYWFYLK